MQPNSTNLSPDNNNTNEQTGINGTELIITNNKTKYPSTCTTNTSKTNTIKWIKISSNSTNKIRWEPIYILRSSAPNRQDCKYFIGKSIDNNLRTYHMNELYDSPDSKYSTKDLNKSLSILFKQNTIDEHSETPMYLYQKPTDSIFNSINIFQDNTNQLSLIPIEECEYHESAGIDEYDRDVTGIWIKTSNTEKTYMSIDKIKTLHYIDDVNPIKYKHKSDNIMDNWVMIENKNSYEDALDLEEEVMALRLERSNSLNSIEDLKHENNIIQKQNKTLNLQMNRLKEALANNDTINQMLQEQKRILEEKQKEIDRLRQELIARSNAKQLNSKFPTVEEVCLDFRSIKNQEFTTVHSKLTKPVKKKTGWNKYYVNKLSHKLLFETLCECYNETLQYHDNIYSSIGDLLQISYDNNTEIDEENKNNNGDNGNGNGNGNKKGNNTLEFLFHRYLTNNYEIMKESKDFKYIKNEKILKECLVKYNDIINILSNDEENELINALKIFINKCCNVCWNMILQRPKLKIEPFEFMTKNKIEFNEMKQQRIIGSNKKDKYILYYAWPGVTQNNMELDNVKPCVLQRNEDFTQTKTKK